MEIQDIPAHGTFKIFLHIVCVTDQDIFTYPNFSGYCHRAFDKTTTRVSNDAKKTFFSQITFENHFLLSYLKLPLNVYKQAGSPSRERILCILKKKVLFKMEISAAWKVVLLYCIAAAGR